MPVLLLMSVLSLMLVLLLLRHVYLLRVGIHRWRRPLLLLFALLLSSCASYQAPPADIPYVRSDWPHWIDSDGDCRNTRAEVLQARSQQAVTYSGKRQCTVVSGRWFDEYTGSTFLQARQVDIDHIVPLAWASRRGGGSWSRAQKQQFANDPNNLMVASSSANRAKGSRGPDTWLPPRKAYHCNYVQQFDGVVKRYRLQYFPAEQRSIRQLLNTCRLSKK